MVFVGYGRKNSYSRGVLFLLQWRDFDGKEFAENESNFYLKKDCGNEKVLLNVRGCNWPKINFIISISCFLKFLFPSAVKFSSFSVGSLSIKDFVKVSKLFNGFFIFLWLTSNFLICCCILTTSQIVFGIESWLNNIQRFCRVPTSYQWEKDNPPFSIAFFHMVTTNLMSYPPS